MMKRDTVLWEFFRYVSLNILGQVAFSCYTMADTFFVAAKLGTAGLTVLNLAFPVFCLINGSGLMLGIGGGAKYAVCKSQGAERRADEIYTDALYLAAGLSAVFVLGGMFFSHRLVRLLGADWESFALTHTYLKVMMLFAPAFLFNHLLQCFVRNDGRPGLSMAAMVTGSFSNVLLDYIFIFPFDMGIFGAILATGLSPVISMLILAPHLIGRARGFQLVKALPRASELGGICSCGVPPMLTEVTSGVVMFLFNFIILGIAGNTGVAAFGVITVLSLAVVSVYTGLAQGMQPVVSRSYGSGDSVAVKRLLYSSVRILLLLSALIYGLICFKADLLVSIFNSERDAVLQSYSVHGVRLYFLACPFLGWNIVFSTWLLSTERPRPAQAVSLLRGFVVLIPAAFLLAYFFHLTGVWCAYPLTEALVALLGMGCYFCFLRQRTV